MLDRKAAPTTTTRSWPLSARWTITIIAMIVAIASAGAVLRLTGSDETSTKTTSSTAHPTNVLAELDGRQFVAVSATEGGQPRQLHRNQRISITFRLSGWVQFGSGCNYVGADWRWDDGRLDWDGPLTSSAAGCSSDADRWLSAFLTPPLTWQLDDDTLVLRSSFGTVTLVDSGAGRKPADLLGERFVADHWSDPEGESPLFRPDVRLNLSFDADGTLHANLGCESVTVPTTIEPGHLRVTGELEPELTTDCSPSMAKQETEWLWDRLARPLRWRTDAGNLALRSGSRMLYLSPAPGVRGSSDPQLLAGDTWLSTSIDSRGARRSGLGDDNPVRVRIDESGAFTANAGCERVSVRGTVGPGWFRHGKQNGEGREDCPLPDAEGWVGKFFAGQPSWLLNDKDHALLISGNATMHLARAK